MGQQPDTESLAERILETLKAKPGQRAGELAAALSTDREAINSLLYGRLKGRCIQDAKYRWKLTSDSPSISPSSPASFADTPLSRLCRYYLACVGYEDEGGVSVFASSNFDDADYVELEGFVGVRNSEIFKSEEAQRLIGKMRKDRSRLTMYLGYPVAAKKQKSKKSDWEGFFLEPLVLYPVEFEEGSAPRIASTFPVFNSSVLRRFTNAQRDQFMDDLGQLEEELGLSDETDLPEVDELCRRLATIRPEWPWVEQPDVANLSADPPLSRINIDGIFNRAVLVLAQRSPYTQGLETELKQLAQLPKEKYSGTALGQWITGNSSAHIATVDKALIEVLPLNQEQRHAIDQAFTSPLTIVTGPPGTGKSQVIANLLINAVWRGKRVLFASKNNKAVDVVELRLNSLGPRPVVLRLGANQYQTKLAEYLIGLLAAKAEPDDQHDFDDAMRQRQSLEQKLAGLGQEDSATIHIRNQTDRLEQEAESARATFGESGFADLREFDVVQAERSALEFAKAHAAAIWEEQSLLARLLWPILRKGRFDRLFALTADIRWLWDGFRLQEPSVAPNDTTMPVWTQFSEQLLDRFLKAKKVKAYFSSLTALQRARSLADIARERVECIMSLAENAEVLWRSWLKLQPSRLSAEDRKLLTKHNTLLEMVMEASSDGRLNDQLRKQYYELFPKIAHLLPCWAVTSLSARGRIPFESGFFDLVVFDEASQCDIASALPLLYRAKSAVVIGDPKQLSHISGLNKNQDQQLLHKFGLLEEFPHWAYSYRSLFDLSCGFVPPDGVVALRDHHRSHADIIEFSNRWFYGGELRVATSYDRLKRPTPTAPGIRWVQVTGDVRRPAAGGAVNPSEARMVIEELTKLLIERGYEGSVGVVSPFREQANLIRELALKDQALAERLQAADFLSETVHRFQGDERDVMIFSPVFSEKTPSGAIVFLKRSGNLFNVAITRARAMLIVVGDRNAAARSDVEYLAAFATYVQDIEEGREDVESIGSFGSDYPTVVNPDQVSDWERLLYRKLYEAGVRTIPQFSVEKYRLDLAVIDGDRRLNIEVDGERYHRNWTGELCRRDQIRNQRMYELGWDVLRFWVPEIRDDMQGCIARVKKWQKANAAVRLNSSSSPAQSS